MTYCIQSQWTRKMAVEFYKPRAHGQRVRRQANGRPEMPRHVRDVTASVSCEADIFILFAAIGGEKRADRHPDDVRNALVRGWPGMMEKHRLESRRYAGVDELRGGHLTVMRFEDAGRNHLFKILAQLLNTESGTGKKELGTELRHAIGDGDDGSELGNAARPRHKLREGPT